MNKYANYQLLTVDGNTVCYSYANISELKVSMDDLFEDIVLENGQKAKVAKNMKDLSLKHLCVYANVYEWFACDLVSSGTEKDFYETINPYVKELLTVSLFSLKELQRFALENEEYMIKDGRINSNQLEKTKLGTSICCIYLD